MKNIDFKLQSTAVVPPTSAGYVKIYANASGQLLFVNADGTTGSATTFAQNISQAGGSIASGVIQPGVVASVDIPSGAYYGATGTSALANKLPIFLAIPNQWLVTVGTSGQKLVIPAYTYT